MPDEVVIAQALKELDQLIEDEKNGRVLMDDIALTTPLYVPLPSNPGDVVAEMIVRQPPSKPHNAG